ncbi:MAG: flavin reductase family protein [Candidatus Acidiferrales bacterium]
MDVNTKKKSLRLITYGLYVATARDGETFAAGTINWVSQSSFTPPLVMAGIKADSRLHEAIARSRAFVIHIVGVGQKTLATSFFKGAERAGDTLNGFAFENGMTGAPVLLDPPAWFECRVVDEIRRGDHTIYVGEVVEAGVRREEQPLTIREAGFTYGG